jgi:hypothetical protein
MLTLQYFTTDNSIFGFERNAKTFFLSLFVLVLILPLVVLAMSSAQDLCTRFIRELKKRTSKRSPSHNLDVEISYPDLIGFDSEPYSEKRY